MAVRDLGVVERRKVEIEVVMVGQPPAGDGILMPPGEGRNEGDGMKKLRQALRREQG
jgi:hypothetical protein